MMMMMKMTMITLVLKEIVSKIYYSCPQTLNSNPKIFFKVNNTKISINEIEAQTSP
jgi:hypothetical protein